MPRFQYIFKHAPKRIYTYESEYNAWEHIRYELEVKHDFWQHGTFIRGMDAETQGELSNISDGQSVILTRCRLPPYLKPYKPRMLQDIEDRQKVHGNVMIKLRAQGLEDEELNMKAMLEVEDILSKRRFPRKRPVHGSTYVDTVPEWYLCMQCGAKGDHESNMCQAPVKHFIPLHKRCAPNGIPRSMLRPATEEEKQTVAMVTTTGEFVMHI